MPRQARKKSGTGIYHAMFRGINGQKIFHANEDFKRMIETLGRYKEICNYELYAYCLMSNHVHILIKEGLEGLVRTCRRIGASYVYWYNNKYDRTGHLFQDRYKSEPVEDTGYFLTVLRYIHQNPLKAGIVRNINDYPWSSFKEYTGSRGICDTEFVLSQFSEDVSERIKIFREFNMQGNDDKCLEYERQERISDRVAARIIREMAGIDDPGKITAYARNERDEIIGKLRERGLSIRQIERLTGVSFAVIRRCKAHL